MWVSCSYLLANREKALRQPRGAFSIFRVEERGRIRSEEAAATSAT